MAIAQHFVSYCQKNIQKLKKSRKFVMTAVRRRYAPVSYPLDGVSLALWSTYNQKMAR